MTVSDTNELIDGIAIVGMAGRFPGAKNISEFWQNLKDGVESVSFFTRQELMDAGINAAQLDNPAYVSAGAVIPDADLFDASFFGYSGREADFMDPQHRMLLECAWGALENAGYTPENFEGDIGVYAGCSMNHYLLNNLLTNRTLLEEFGGFQAMIGNDKDFLATRISYKLNLTGPSLDIQTACSTSLVAVQTASQSLLNYQCDMALAGGVSIGAPLKRGYVYQEGMIMSPDGHCRSFDADANGTVFGDGAGMVVLKRLEEAVADGDHIYAVIRSAAINNDGAAKVGYTAPSIEGQSRVIVMAQALAEVDAESISYIEAHGTGTSLGDPIEIAALTQAFRESTDEKNFCAIGSVKSNIGHLDAAAGIAGLIKTALALKNKQIPPSLHFKSPNPKLGIEESPFYVNTDLSQWPEGNTPRRAGVSAFGIGGTNVHVIMEEFVEEVSAKSDASSKPYHLLPLSAKSETALSGATENLAGYFRNFPETNIENAAYTLKTGRRVFDWRQVVVCKNSDHATEILSSRDPAFMISGKSRTAAPSVAFMFPGQGAQYINMASDLYRFEPAFREAVDRCVAHLTPLMGMRLSDIIYPKEEELASSKTKLDQTAVAQPALFTIEYALAQLWKSWGIRPGAMIGHSLGEYTAACIAGVMSLEDALSLIALRSELMQKQAPGCMLAVHLPEEEIRPLMGSDVSIAAINSPFLCTVSGPEAAVGELEKMLEKKQVRCQLIHTSHAFHSEMMRPVCEPFHRRIGQMHLQAPQIPYISNVTGTWITEKEATDPEYWVRHLIQPVRFSQGISELLNDPDAILLEVGPGQTLCILTALQPKPEKPMTVPSLRHPMDKQSDAAFILKALGQLWVNGASVDWSNGCGSGEKPQRVALPSYPFQRKRHWIHPDATGFASEQTENLEAEKGHGRADAHPSRPIGEPDRKLAPEDTVGQICRIWEEMLGVERVGPQDDFYALGGHSLLATQVLSRVNKTFGISVPLESFFEATNIQAISELVNTIMWSRNRTRGEDTSNKGEREIFTL